MKQVFSYPVLMLVLFSFVFTCCNKNEPLTSSPSVFIPDGGIKNQKGDTLQLKKNNKVYVLDNIDTGDTIIIHSNIYGITNNLKELRVYSSANDSVEFIWHNLENFLSYPENNTGYFTFKENIQTAPFRFSYIPKKENKELTLTFEVTSDGQPDANYYKMSILTPSIEPIIDSKFQAIADSVIQSFTILGAEFSGKGKIPQEISYTIQKDAQDSANMKMVLNYAKSTEQKIIYDFTSELADLTSSDKGYIEIYATDTCFKSQRWYFSNETGSAPDYDNEESKSTAGYHLLSNKSSSNVAYSFYNLSGEIEKNGVFQKDGTHRFINVTAKNDDENQSEETEGEPEISYNKVKVKLINKIPD